MAGRGPVLSRGVLRRSAPTTLLLSLCKGYNLADGPDDYVPPMLYAAPAHRWATSTG